MQGQVKAKEQGYFEIWFWELRRAEKSLLK